MSEDWSQQILEQKMYNLNANITSNTFKSDQHKCILVNVLIVWCINTWVTEKNFTVHCKVQYHPHHLRYILIYGM